jgi:hypothetical protein
MSTSYLAAESMSREQLLRALEIVGERFGEGEMGCPQTRGTYDEEEEEDRQLQSPRPSDAQRARADACTGVCYRISEQPHPLSSGAVRSALEQVAAGCEAAGKEVGVLGQQPQMRAPGPQAQAAVVPSSAGAAAPAKQGRGEPPGGALASGKRRSSSELNSSPVSSLWGTFTNAVEERRYSHDTRLPRLLAFRRHALFVAALSSVVLADVQLFSDVGLKWRSLDDRQDGVDDRAFRRYAASSLLSAVLVICAGLVAFAHTMVLRLQRAASREALPPADATAISLVGNRSPLSSAPCCRATVVEALIVAGLGTIWTALAAASALQHAGLVGSLSFLAAGSFMVRTTAKCTMQLTTRHPVVCLLMLISLPHPSVMLERHSCVLRSTTTRCNRGNSRSPPF